MADRKVSELTNLAAPASTDLVYVVHDPSGTPVPRQSTVAQLLGTSVQLVNAPTGVSVTDSAAIQAAHDALPAAGGRLVLAQGTYDITAGVTFTKPVHMSGAGAGDSYANAMTKLLSTSATVDALTLNAHGCTLVDFAMRNTHATNTAGALLRVSLGDNLRLSRVSFYGGYDCVAFDSARHYQIEGCQFADAVRYYLRLRNTVHTDAGDGLIVGCIFNAWNTTRNASAGIRWESGGGLKVIGSKFNGNEGQFDLGVLGVTSFDYAIHICPANGVNSSIFIIEGNSIEGTALAGVYATQQAGTSTLSRFNIVGNEFIQAGVTFDPTTAAAFADIVISGNTFGSTIGDSIYVRRCDNVAIGVNNHRTVTGACVRLETDATNVSVMPQQAAADAPRRLIDNTVTNSSHALSNHIEHTYTREIPACSSTATLWTVKLLPYTALILETEVSGNHAGVGAFAVKKRIALQVTSPGANVSGAGAVDTDFDSSAVTGTVPVVTYDTATAETVKVTITKAGAGTDAFGKATIRIIGVGPVAVTYG